MRRIARNIALALLAVAIVVAGLWTWSRLRGPSPAQQRALALLQQPPAPPGRDAFAALWLLHYDVPGSQLQAIADADSARIAALLAAGGDEAAASTQSFRSEAADRYPDLSPSPADADLFCRPREDDCLARVRSDPEAYRALVARNRRLLDRVAGLSAYDYYRYGMPHDFVAPPSFAGVAGIGITRIAHEFAGGDRDAALAAACEGVLTWRRLGAHSDTLVMRMLGATYATDGYARLFAGMLAELPVDHPLPAACGRAFAEPEVAELSICAQMQGEFLHVSGITRDLRARTAAKPWIDRALMPLAFDAGMTLAAIAPAHARSCTPEAEAALARDAPVPQPEASQSLWRLDCVANFVGCVLADIGAPAYRDYQVRAQDHGARLDLMATLLRLRAHSGDAKSLRAALADEWARTRSAGREARIGDDGTTLAVRQRWTGRGEWWQVPMPASAIATATRE